MKSAIEYFKFIGTDNVESMLKCIGSVTKFKVHLPNDEWHKPSVINVIELKEIIDAWKLVEKCGGINGAIDATGTSYIKPSDWEDLNNAINIVEQCQ